MWVCRASVYVCVCLVSVYMSSSPSFSVCAKLQCAHTLSSHKCQADSKLTFFPHADREAAELLERVREMEMAFRSPGRGIKRAPLQPPFAFAAADAFHSLLQ